MRISIAATAIAVAAFLAGASSSAVATGTGLQPLDLSVEGGEDAWRADPSFAVSWVNPPAGLGRSIVAVHYRVLDPSGGVALGEKKLNWPAASIEHLPVPFTPGAYTAEIWLEDDSGMQGTPATAKLRFDDARPWAVQPLPVEGWIGRTAFPYLLHLSHPSGPEPLSGIRGYAVSIDRSAGAEPCADIERCTEAETDLRAGSGGDSLAITELPEGTSYLHAVAVSGSAMRSASTGSIPLHVDTTDPVTRLAGVPGDWSSRPATLTATAADAASGMVATGSGMGPFTAIRIDGSPPTVAAGASVAATVIESGIHTVTYYARDAAGNVADGGSANGLANRPPATAVVRIDRDAPLLSFSNAQNPRDPEMIEASVSDSLSGVDRSRGWISVRQAGSSERFTSLPTEAAAGVLRARWDSKAFAPGEYEFQATGYDVAGNAGSTVLRANGSRMLLHSPLKVATTLVAGLGELAQRTVPFGHPAFFSGRVVAGRRALLAGAPVQVVERFETGSAPSERVSTVRTDASGAFAVRIAPGPSRRVFAVLAPTPTLSGSSSRAVRLRVRGRLRMAVSTAVAEVGGPPIVFAGRVLAGGGGAIPAGGKLVQLQFRLPGLPWSEFRTIRTDPRGRFHYAYRFTDDDSRGARFQFRAFAPAQNGWAFEPAGSPPVVVRGR